MPNSSVLVSVVIPAYNAARYIGTALESALAQTHRRLEVLVVDDGSSDETAAIARAVAAEDTRVRVIGQDRGGVAAARNLGVAEAEGEWIAPLDADDAWEPEKIEKQLAAAEAGKPRTGLIYTWTRYVDELDKQLAELRPEWEGEVFIPLVLCNFIGHASAPLIRRRALQEAGGYDTAFFQAKAQGCEDWDLYLQIARRYEFRVVREFLVRYRVLPGGMSRQHRTMEESYRLMIRKLRAAVPDLPGRLRRWSESQFYAYLEAIARANGDIGFATRCWLRSCCANPVRLLHPGTLQRIWDRFPRLGNRAQTLPNRLRWDGKETAAVYDWFEARTLGRSGTWWKRNVQQS